MSMNRWIPRQHIDRIILGGGRVLGRGEGGKLMVMEDEHVQHMTYFN